MQHQLFKKLLKCVGIFTIILFSTNTIHAQFCIDSSLIDPLAFCPEIYDPVCGCDDVTYSNSCIAIIQGGVTFWTPGECGGLIIADPCTDIAGIDFGECALFLGYGIVNGVCTPISGCGTFVNNVEYNLAITASEAECQSNCNETEFSEPCDDLNDIDFGLCAMPLGIAVINGQCLFIDGCGTVINGVDYASSFYSNMDSCQLCLATNQIDDLSMMDISIYPNPTNGKLTIKRTTDISGYLVMLDLTGRLVHESRIESNLNELDLSELGAGTYVLKVYFDNRVLTSRVFKR